MAAAGERAGASALGSLGGRESEREGDARRLTRAGTPLTAPEPPRAMSETDARSVWTLSARLSGVKCRRPIAAGAFRVSLYPSKVRREGRGRTGTDHPLAVALPVQPAARLLDRLLDVVGDRPALDARHQAPRAEQPRELRVALEQGKHVARRDELVRDGERAVHELLDELLAADDVGPLVARLLRGGALRKDVERLALGRRRARVREEDAAAQGVELHRARRLGRDVDLVRGVGRLA